MSYTRPSSRHIALGCWIALIFASSTGIAGRLASQLYSDLFAGPALGVSVSGHFLQKAYHVFLFGVLGWLIARDQTERTSAVVRVAVWSFSIGVLSELAQIPFEGRGPSLSDALLNTVSGCFVGWLGTRLGSSARSGASHSGSVSVPPPR